MPYYDKETVRAVGEIDLLSYLERTAPDELIRQGAGRYTTRTHDSLSISNGKWYWFSRGIGGRNALTYLIKVKGLSFLDAVEELLRDSYKSQIANYTSENQERSPLVLPTKAENDGYARAYLSNRGIREDVIIAVKKVFTKSLREFALAWEKLNEKGGEETLHGSEGYAPVLLRGLEGEIDRLDDRMGGYCLAADDFFGRNHFRTSERLWGAMNKKLHLQSVSDKEDKFSEYLWDDEAF